MGVNRRRAMLSTQRLFTRAIPKHVARVTSRHFSRISGVPIAQNIIRIGSRQGNAIWNQVRRKATVALERPIVLEQIGSTLGAASTPKVAKAAWSELTTATGRKSITIWLFGSCAVVFSMVILGGVTRLTHSGLSMTEWKVRQLLPPMNQAEWEEEFGKYKQFPEYKELNPNMTLAEFKPIFAYEYGHRMLGRAIGVIFAVPATYFAMRGYIKAPLAWRLGALFTMGGCQGAIGWWMVKSGLEESLARSTGDDAIVRVSPYRLATHLLGAFTIYAGLVWTGLSVMARVPAELEVEQLRSVLKLRRVAHPVSVLIGVTAISGAFVAGMKAGHHYNTFPLMDGQLFPERYWEMTPWYRNMFENIAAVQFDHRVLAVSTLTSVVGIAAMARGMQLPAPTRRAVALLLAATCGQVALGITTLHFAVPVSLGAAHQAGALTVFTVAIYLLHTIRLKNPAAAWQRIARARKTHQH